MKKYSTLKIEKLLESEKARTLKSKQGKNSHSIFYFDIIPGPAENTLEIAINKDEFNLAVYPLNEILSADMHFEQILQTF